MNDDLHRIAKATERQTGQLQEIRDHLGCLLVIAWVFLAASIVSGVIAGAIYWRLISNLTT